jgi:hypothetical protein
VGALKPGFCVGVVRLGEGKEQVALEQAELRQQGFPGSTTCDLERFVDQGQAISGVAGLGVCTGVEEEQQLPEDRRGLQALVQVHALLYLYQSLIGLSRPGASCTEETRPDRAPDLELVILDDLQDAERPVSGAFGLAPPHVQEAGVEQRVRQRERMLQFGCQGDGLVGTLERAIGVAQQPEHERRCREAGHAGVVPEPEPARWVRLGREIADGPIQVSSPPWRSLRNT